ncbi:EAL domain-containing protein [Spirochaeta africana DSM 8902]|uniref:EAL domain-containing protein n=2 Tax=Spirochaeta TaxID=146 RepID=H9UID8_SPIAZ|nr:EAL domain-containing protein [Spirochaeta africana]AFG37281.1 EAL domain-containing protein [Spirochaeta africana DSM 8902]
MPSSLNTEQIYSLLGISKLKTVYHPIVSLAEQKIFGLEALSRGLQPDCNEVPPLQLFAAANQQGLSLELDRLCRSTALHHTKPHIENDEIPLLFINLDLSHLQQPRNATGYLLQQVQSAGIPPHRIAIELVESKVANASLLKAFVQTYRHAGFLIVLDDFGADHSNLDRILLVRPDILKIDRNLIAGIQEDHYRQAVVQSIITLAHRIGSLVLAEGVETLPEVQTCSRLGIDLFQGYYFAYPHENPCSQSDETIQLLHQCFTRIADGHRRSTRAETLSRSVMRSTAERVARQLAVDSITEYERTLRAELQNVSGIECAYCLDLDGTQISSTVQLHANPPRHPVFAPAEKGFNHKLKPYFAQLRKHHFDVSDTYISCASGQPCTTASLHFTTSDGNKRILCIDYHQREQSISGKKKGSP